MGKKKINAYASTPYTQVPDGFWVCKEFNELSAQARCIFTIALSKWNPYEPKREFPMLYEELRSITGFQFGTISKAIKLLIAGDFLDRPKRGAYPHNTAMYRLNSYWIERKYEKSNAK